MLNPLRSTARTFTGSTYAVLGFQAFREPGGRVNTAGNTLAAMRKVLPLPADDELLVRGNRGADGGRDDAGTGPDARGLCGGIVWLAGADDYRRPRLLGHRGPRHPQNATQASSKNVAMLGGLLCAVLDARRSEW
jgi:putative oxidoreductase